MICSPLFRVVKDFILQNSSLSLSCYRNKTISNNTSTTLPLYNIVWGLQPLVHHPPSITPYSFEVTAVWFLKIELWERVERFPVQICVTSHNSLALLVYMQVYHCGNLCWGGVVFTLRVKFRGRKGEWLILNLPLQNSIACLWLPKDWEGFRSGFVLVYSKPSSVGYISTASWRQ